MSAPILRLQGVTRAFGGIRALDEVSIDVPEGSITGLIGPNGAGKTTLFDLITGIGRPDRGTVEFQGRRIDGLPHHRIARMGIGRTFQLVRMLPRLSAAQNLVVAQQGHPGESAAGALTGRWHQAEANAARRATNWLAACGMQDRADVAAGDLSYGQSKLIELARVLMLDTPMVLLDEPMAGILPTLRRELLGIIRKARDEGRTFLIIEHDIEMIMQECDTVIVLDHGQVIAHGKPSEIRGDARVVDAYLGAEEE